MPVMKLLSKVQMFTESGSSSCVIRRDCWNRFKEPYLIYRSVKWNLSREIMLPQPCVLINQRLKCFISLN